MTKINVAKSQLLGKHNEINAWKRNDSLLAYFHKSKIDEFYNNNRIRINTILSDFEQINMKYFEHDKDEEGKWRVRIEGEGEARKQVCKEGMTVEGHTEEITRFLAEQTVMEI